VPDLDFGGLTVRSPSERNGSAKTDLNVIVIPRAAQRAGRASRSDDDDLNLIWEYSPSCSTSPPCPDGDPLPNLLTDAVSRPNADDRRSAADGGR